MCVYLHELHFYASSARFPEDLAPESLPLLELLWILVDGQHIEHQI